MTFKAFQLAAILGAAAPGSEPALLVGWSRINGRPRSPVDHAARVAPSGPAQLRPLFASVHQMTVDTCKHPPKFRWPPLNDMISQTVAWSRALATVRNTD